MRWLRAGIIASILGLSVGIGISISACAIVPGSHKEQRCTLVFQTPKMIVSPDGVLMVDQREVKSLTCQELWVSPEEK